MRIGAANNATVPAERGRSDTGTAGGRPVDDVANVDDDERFERMSMSMRAR